MTRPRNGALFISGVDRMKLWKLLPGAKRAVNIETGENISRRQYDKIRRGTDLSNEKLAQLNRVTNPQLSELRPARGRKSALKASPTEQALIAEARQEDRQRRKELAAEEKKRKADERELARRLNRPKRKLRKVTAGLLKPGHKAARIPFDTYEEYLQLFDQAKRGGKVIFYGLGVQGHHENTGAELDITVFTMRTLDRPVSEDDFDGAMFDVLENYAYFVFENYWMHLAFKREVYEARAKFKKEKKPRTKGKRK